MTDDEARRLGTLLVAAEDRTEAASPFIRIGLAILDGKPAAMGIVNQAAAIIERMRGGVVE